MPLTEAWKLKALKRDNLSAKTQGKQMSQGSKKKAWQGKAAAAPSNSPVSPAGEMPGVEGSLSLESENRPAGLNDRWTVPIVCILLTVATWLVFGQTLRHDFVNFDDDEYVYNNVQVAHGLT